MKNYSPPSGTEKQILDLVAKESEALTVLLKRIWENPPSAQIEISHAREGVRTNGTERVTSVLDVMEKMEEAGRRYHRHHNEVSAIEAEVGDRLIAVRKLMEKLPLCSRCKGKKGYGRNGIPRTWKAGSGVGMSIKQWEDCEICDGRGILCDQV